MTYLTTRSNKHVAVRQKLSASFFNNIWPHVSFSQANKNKSDDGPTFVLYISVNFEHFIAMEIGLKRDIVGLNVVSCTFPPQKNLYLVK